jgi:Asp/Glu/hydantoin racemase
MSDQCGREEGTLFVIHTVVASVEPIAEAFGREAPWLRLVNLVDEALLAQPEMKPNSPKARQRFGELVRLCDDAGADGVLVACSTYSRVIDRDRSNAGSPLFWIDEPMMEEAVQMGKRVALVATNPETLEASRRTLLRAAERRKIAVEVVARVDDEAFQCLLRGDRGEHDERVLRMAESVKSDADVVVLAQASMGRLMTRCQEAVGIPVLSSPGSCARAVTEALFRRAGGRRLE